MNSPGIYGLLQVALRLSCQLYQNTPILQMSLGILRRTERSRIIPPMPVLSRETTVGNLEGSH